MCTIIIRKDTDEDYHATGHTTLSTQQQIGGDVSPTGVADISAFPNFVWAEEPPTWYTTVADVDELLSEAEALNWLADTGDLNEDYQPSTQTVSKTGSEPSLLSICGEPDISQKQLPVQPLEQVTQMQTQGHMSEQADHAPATFAAHSEKKRPSYHLMLTLRMRLLLTFLQVLVQ